MTTPPKHRGRRPDYVEGPDGRKIDGLSRNKHDGRYYATHSRPRKWFGAEFGPALAAYREWQAHQAGKRAQVVLVSPTSIDLPGTIREQIAAIDARIAPLLAQRERLEAALAVLVRDGAARPTQSAGKARQRASNCARRGSGSMREPNIKRP